MSGRQPKQKQREDLDEYGRTPLHYAAVDSRSDEVARLLATGVNVNAQDDNGWSALHFAAQAMSPVCTALLLQAGADISLQDSFGNNALLRAVFSSKGEGSVIRLLLDAGSNPIELNKHGVSPVSLARTITNFDIAQHFKDIQDT